MSCIDSISLSSPQGHPRTSWWSRTKHCWLLAGGVTLFWYPVVNWSQENCNCSMVAFHTREEAHQVTSCQVWSEWYDHWYALLRKVVKDDHCPAHWWKVVTHDYRSLPWAWLWLGQRWRWDKLSVYHLFHYLILSYLIILSYHLIVSLYLIILSTILFYPIILKDCLIFHLIHRFNILSIVLTTHQILSFLIILFNILSYHVIHRLNNWWSNWRWGKLWRRFRRWICWATRSGDFTIINYHHHHHHH